MHHDACHKTIPTWALPFHRHATTTTYVLDKENCEIVCKRNDWSQLVIQKQGNKENFCQREEQLWKDHNTNIAFCSCIHCCLSWFVMWDATTIWVAKLHCNFSEMLEWQKFASAFQLHWPDNNELGVRDKWERL
jgi:hypothetical protein